MKRPYPETVGRTALSLPNYLSPASARIVTGAAHNPGLVLANGASGDAMTNWGTVLHALSQHYRVIGPDRPGTGTVPRAAAPPDLDELADDLVDAAVRAGLQRFTLCGYCLGGPIAIRAATRHPDRVSSLVLTATFANANARMRLLIRLQRALLVFADFAGHRNDLAELLLLTSVSAERLDQMRHRDLDAAVQAAAENIPPGFHDNLDLAEAIDVRADLAAITAPTLVISTTLDQIATPEHHRELAAAIPGARLAELGSGHMPFAERPREWLDLVVSFLGQHTQPRPR